MFTFKYILGPRPKADGTHAVVLRITAGRVKAHAPTGLFVLPTDFDAAAHTDAPRWVLATNKAARTLNPPLLRQINAARQAALDRPHLTPADLVAVLAGKELAEPPGAPEFFALAAVEVARCRRTATRNKNGTALMWLRRYAPAGPLPPGAITRDFVRGFEAFLFQQPSIKSANTVATNLNVVAGLLRKMIDAGHVTVDPFLRYRLPARETKKTTLTTAEIRTLVTVELPDDDPRHRARLAFALQFYCHGARISDMLRLRWSDVAGGRVSYRMGKTERLKDVAVTAPLAAVLARCQAISRGRYVLPYLPATFDELTDVRQHQELSKKTALVNKFLSQLAVRVGITHKISSHVARHSLAGAGYEATKDVRAVQALLGHTKVATTEKYLRELRQDQTDAAAASVYGE